MNFRKFELLHVSVVRTYSKEDEFSSGKLLDCQWADLVAEWLNISEQALSRGVSRWVRLIEEMSPRVLLSQGEVEFSFYTQPRSPFLTSDALGAISETFEQASKIPSSSNFFSEFKKVELSVRLDEIFDSDLPTNFLSKPSYAILLNTRTKGISVEYSIESFFLKGQKICLDRCWHSQINLPEDEMSSIRKKYILMKIANERKMTS